MIKTIASARPQPEGEGGFKHKYMATALDPT